MNQLRTSCSKKFEHPPKLTNWSKTSSAEIMAIIALTFAQSENRPYLKFYSFLLKDYCFDFLV